jgi:hypothetical protein
MATQTTTWVRRLQHVRVYLDATTPSSLCFVTMPRANAPTAIVVHTNCNCLSVTRLVSRVCVFSTEDLVDCAYPVVECGGVLAQGPRTFTCENAWVSARAMHGFMLRQETCHAHPVCAQLDPKRPCVLLPRCFVHADGLEPVCTHCVRLTDAEMDARLDVLLTLPSEMARLTKRPRVHA